MMYSLSLISGRIWRLKQYLLRLSDRQFEKQRPKHRNALRIR
jgi:hypothetical protein